MPADNHTRTRLPRGDPQEEEGGRAASGRGHDSDTDGTVRRGNVAAMIMVRETDDGDGGGAKDEGRRLRVPSPAAPCVRKAGTTKKSYLIPPRIELGTYRV